MFFYIYCYQYFYKQFNFEISVPLTSDTDDIFFSNLFFLFFIKIFILFVKACSLTYKKILFTNFLKKNQILFI